MDDSYQPLIENENKKSTSYKKFGAALGVTGITLAAALLLSGRSEAPVQRPTSLIQMPDDMVVDNSTELISETCMTSFDRIWADNGNSIEAPTFHNSLDANGKYNDPTFKADMSSLYWEDQKSANQFYSQVQTYQQYEGQYGIIWKRPSQIPGHKNPSLWGKNGVTPKASAQGALGDCWFLSSASAVAAVPSRIHNIFQNSEYPSDGAFQVYLYVRGERVSVTIDDRVPVLNLGEGYSTQYPLVNSKPPPSGAWWLVMLEKAFAKLNVNYTNINGGSPGQALRALTGMPVSEHDSSSMTDDELWNIVLSGAKAKNPMAAACQVSHYNMVSGHAYGILDGLCLTVGGQCHTKLIKMRNPWGISKYDGPWSEKSSEWTEEFKKQADLAGTNEGEYWVALSDWRTFYSQAFNTHYRNDWIIQSIEGKPSDFSSSTQNTAWLSFENTVEQDVVLSCDQWQKRLFPPGCKNKYTPQDYVFVMMDTKLNQMKTSPSQATCNGGAMKLPKLAKGQYNIEVLGFSGADTGHEQVWKMRAFTEHEAIHITNRKNPFDSSSFNNYNY